MIPTVQILGYKLRFTHAFLIFSCYLLMEPIFSWFFIQDALLVTKYQQIMSIGILFAVMFKFKRLSLTEQSVVVVFILLLGKLVFESMYFFGTLFEHFQMFEIIFPVLFVIIVKLIFKRLDLDIDVLEFVAKFYLIVYVLFMIVFGRDFSLTGLESLHLGRQLGPFSGDSRIIHAKSIFLIGIPFLWYLDKYIRTKERNALVLLLFSFSVIIIHQHRSVWASLILATAVYLIILAVNDQSHRGRLLNFSLSAFFVLVALSFVILFLYPDLLTYFAGRFSDILEPNKEGTTGHFRALQREVYFALYLEKQFLGWSFEGFELPNPIVDWWPAKTGQHFHEGYIEILFYHGLVGLLLKYFFLLFILLKSFSRNLSRNAIILIPFCLSGFLFSLVYVLPLMFWGHVGLCLYYLDRKV